MKFMIFIPAYYAEKTLVNVVNRIPQSVYDSTSEILIQDDASKDRTFDIAEELSKKICKVTAVRNERNLGYGGTQKKAYIYALAKGYDAVVMIHGDNQHPPEHLQDLLNPLIEERADIVLGSRILGDPLKSGMPIYKYFGNRILTLATNLVFQKRLTDYHTGYLAFSAKALRKVDFTTCCDGHEISSEILLRAFRAGLRIQEVAVPTFYGPDSRSISLKTSIKYGLNVFRMLFTEMYKYLFHKLFANKKN